LGSLISARPGVPLDFAFPHEAGALRRRVYRKWLLTHPSTQTMLPQVRSNMKQLRSRLQEAMAAPGKQSELASFLSAPLASVSRWLSGKREPGGEITLSMLAWVQAEEANKTSLGRAQTRPEPKTQLRKSQHENQKSGPRRKYQN